MGSITQGGIAFGAGLRELQQRMDANKQLNQQARAAEQFVTSLSEEEQQGFGVPDLTAFKNLSARDKLATVTGALQRQGYQQAMQEMEASRLAQERERLAQAGLRSQQAQAAAAARVPARFIEEAEADITGPYSPAGFEEALAQRTGLSPGALGLMRAFAAEGAPLPSSVLDDFLASGARNRAPALWEQDGVKAIYSPYTGAFQKIEEAIAQQKPFDVPGYHLVPTPSGGWRYLRKVEDKNDPARLAEFDTDGDGILSTAEVYNFMQTEKMGAYPGMRVGPKAATSAPGASDKAEPKDDTSGAAGRFDPKTGRLVPYEKKKKEK